ncbi:MAG: tripartite tricarboxylate transporter permease [Chloroflexi bacterium]|nr:tripartite tricarboxylate transporter permease [Chloroflexota bacterium]
MFAGSIVGLIIGVLPGIGMVLGMALFLPFVFVMRPEDALTFLVALGSTAVTAGSITAILLNIPGEAASIATLMDGYPMSQKGQAGRALGAALTSSVMGGVFSGLLALGMVFLILPMILAITSADMVFLILLGLAFIGVLGTGSTLKGLISGGLGLMIGFMGVQLISAVPRFTFGSIYLYEGIGMIPLAMGLYAIPEMIELASKGGNIAKAEVVIKGMREVLEGIKDVFRHWLLWLRSTMVGYIVGVIPGIGIGVAPFVAYGQAKRASKHPERFGTGIVEGVIAPESSNNAVQGGALLTTLALGIPGSASMAILLGAFLMLGLIPGPKMMIDHLDLSLTLLLVVIFGNVIGALICLLAAPYLAKVALVSVRILVPSILVIILVSTFVQEQRFSDVIIALVFTGLGLAMNKYGYSRAALFLGYILGPLFEKYLFVALQISGPLFFVRPISLTLILILLVLFTYRPMGSLLQRRFKHGVKGA